MKFKNHLGEIQNTPSQVSTSLPTTSIVVGEAKAKPANPKNAHKAQKSSSPVKDLKSLSTGNQRIILAFQPNATRVGGIRQWQAEGRTVAKGQKPITIWAPCKNKSDETFFLKVQVYDISQTTSIGA